ncbi:MAG: phytanoyl-CoA dioxygenase family protein, partial [Planctomycetota bacterium]
MTTSAAPSLQPARRAIAASEITKANAEAYLHGDYDRRHVTAEEYRHFRQWGFLKIEGLLSPEDVDELDQHTKDLMAGRLPEQLQMDEIDPRGSQGTNLQQGEEDTLRHLFRPPEGLTEEEKAQLFLRIHMLHRHLPLHERYLLHPRVLDILEVIIGPDVLALQSMLFLKPPGRSGQGWHQDAYYIPTHPDTLCGAWIAIDDADEFNGALWMAKGSSAEPVHPPCPNASDGIKPYGFGERLIANLEHVQGVSEPDDDKNTLSPIANRYDNVLVPAKKGDVIFFNGHVLHRSKSNVTKDRFRRAFVGHYCNARSFTQWGGYDHHTPQQEKCVNGLANGSHILARGDTHLPFAKPKFETPCAAMLPEDVRRDAL